MITAFLCYGYVNFTLPSPFKELWIILFSAIYTPLIVIIILLFIFRYYGTKNRKTTRDFLKRLIPGMAGGLVVLIVTQFQSSLPSSPNLIDTVIPRLLSSIEVVLIAVVIFFMIYLMVVEIK